MSTGSDRSSWPRPRLPEAARRRHWPVSAVRRFREPSVILNPIALTFSPAVSACLARPRLSGRGSGRGYLAGGYLSFRPCFSASCLTSICALFQSLDCVGVSFEPIYLASIGGLAAQASRLPLPPVARLIRSLASSAFLALCSAPGRMDVSFVACQLPVIGNWERTSRPNLPRV